MGYAYSTATIDKEFLGQFLHPIKALIKSESDNFKKQKGVLDLLYNVVDTDTATFAITQQNGLDLFQVKEEGQSSNVDYITGGFNKTITHKTFSKTIFMYEETMQDSVMGFGKDLHIKLPIKTQMDAKQLPEAFFRTRTRLGAWALANATAASAKFGGKEWDLTAPDGLPLFSNAHKYSNPKYSAKTQSNYFYGDVAASAAEFTTALAKISNKMRNFKDEQNETMGFVPDICVLPCNRPAFEAIAKTVIGSERVAGSANNDINIQYGNWTLVVLDGWESADDRFIVMSSSANKQLMGNIFSDRIPFYAMHNFDVDKGVLSITGKGRIGAGFGNWKHVAMVLDSASAVTGCTAL